jgi:hypothetical protein
MEDELDEKCTRIVIYLKVDLPVPQGRFVTALGIIQ